MRTYKSFWVRQHEVNDHPRHKNGITYSRSPVHAALERVVPGFTDFDEHYIYVGGLDVNDRKFVTPIRLWRYYRKWFRQEQVTAHEFRLSPVHEVCLA